jgi:uncharacterized membrane protein
MGGARVPLWRLLLAHHPPERFDRCFRVAGIALCARCSGLYPALLLGLSALFWTGGWPEQPWESEVLVLLALPALLDWAYGLFVYRASGHGRRFLTGALLGLSLARVLHLHLLSPFGPTVREVLGFLSAGAALALVLRLRLGPASLDDDLPPDRS